MSITVTFNGYEEMMGFARQLIGETQAEQKAPVKVSKAKAEVKEPITEEGPTLEHSPNQEANRAERATEMLAEERTYVLEEVRAELAKLTRSGKQKEVKELLTSFGAKNLSSVKPEDYAALMEKAGAI